MLECRHVTKKLGSFTIKEIDFTLPDGYIMGLIGPNGSGKTSLLHLMMGLYRPREGRILIDGLDTVCCEREIKSRIGCVLNEELYEQGLTLSANADACGKYYEEYDRESFREYCGRFGLDTSRRLGAFSKGEKLKFQFAFALSHHPRLLLLDEPTASFDPEFRAEFLKILTEFVSDGRKSVVLATHVTEDLDRIADYLTFLYNGRLLLGAERSVVEDSFRLVSGERYKLNLLPQERVICREDGSFSSRALVRHGQYSHYDRELTVETPSVEELMYYMIKGEQGNGAKSAVRLSGK